MVVRVSKPYSPPTSIEAPWMPTTWSQRARRAVWEGTAQEIPVKAPLALIWSNPMTQQACSSNELRRVFLSVDRAWEAETWTKEGKVAAIRAPTQPLLWLVKAATIEAVVEFRTVTICTHRSNSDRKIARKQECILTRCQRFNTERTLSLHRPRRLTYKDTIHTQPRSITTITQLTCVAMP